MYDKQNRERLGKVTAQMKSIISAREKKGGDMNSEEASKYFKLQSEFFDIEESIDRNEGSRGPSIDAFPAERIRDEFRLTNGTRRERERNPDDRAFANFLRHGMENLDADDRQLMAARFHSGSGIQNAQSSTGSQGGYVVPQGFSAQLEEAKKWFGGIDGVVGKFSTGTGAPWPWPTINDTTNKGRIIGQNVQVTETDLVFGQVTFNAYVGSSDLVLVPAALMEDSYFDLNGLVANLLGTRLGRLFNNKCTVGSGTGEPTGIVTAAVSAGSTYTFPVGNTTGLTYAALVNVEHAVDPAYRYNPSSAWMFSDAQLKVIKLLVDGNNRPLWQPGLTASFQDGAGVDITASKPTILGHPYFINQDMAVPAANTDSLLFGDMSTFKVREVAGGTTVLRLVERYADYWQVGFIAFQRFDSNLIDAGTHPICVGVNSAT
jgi:HK97 family phage major capsid protein